MTAFGQAGDRRLRVLQNLDGWLVLAVLALCLVGLVLFQLPMVVWCHMLMSRCGTRWWPPYLARYRRVASMKPIYSPAGIRYIMESGIIIITQGPQAGQDIWKITSDFVGTRIVRIL